MYGKQPVTVERAVTQQEAKKSDSSSFTARHLGKLKLACTGPKVISTSPKIFLMSRIDYSFFRNLNSPRNFTYPLGKLRIEFTGKIAKSTSTSLSDMIFLHTAQRNKYCIFIIL